MQHTHTSHLYSTYFAPRGRRRIYSLGMQLAQLYLSPFDKLIGVIGEPGSGKSALIKGMFPNLELTNDDDGVNIRPLPLLEQDSETGFFSPHTYHLDIRFETGFTSMSVLADAILQALHRGKRVIVEHFDLIYPFLGMN
ncbi:MAG: alanine-tRNA synthetase second additional domain-containing protein, partial [Clostridia bacterium]|nr:alanine-tRNA synthetase second additional domain-containing protein [Clostridia bacterium]